MVVAGAGGTSVSEAKAEAEAEATAEAPPGDVPQGPERLDGGAIAHGPLLVLGEEHVQQLRNARPGGGNGGGGGGAARMH